jgi:hypothetical protein
VETGCRGGQGSPRAVAPSERKEHGRLVNEQSIGREFEGGCYDIHEIPL